MATSSTRAEAIGVLNLDTHILLGLLEGTLRPREEQLVFGEAWGVSPIVLWEMFDLAKRGYVTADLDAPSLQLAIQEIPLLPLSLEVARIASRLDFHTDPVDEIIAATSIHYRAPLLTRDERIRLSRLVPFAN
jgi:PIN domain nuclease of toxin-antitoxin system